MKKYLLFLIFIVILTGCSEGTKISKEVINLVTDKNFQQAEKILEELNSSTSLDDEEKNEVKSKIQKELITKIEKLSEEFIKDEINAKSMNEILNSYDSLGMDEISKVVKEKREDFNKLINSRESFAKGEMQLQKKQHKSAIDEFTKVIEEDSKYQQSQDYIRDCLPELLKDVEENVKNMAKSYDVIVYLKDHEKYFTDNETFNTLFEDGKSAYYDESMRIAKEHREKKEYDKAVKELSTLISTVDTDDEVKTLLTEVKDEQKEQERARKNNLLANMNQQYDSMDDLTRIAPKGIDGFNLNIPNGSFIFYPVVQISGQDLESGILAISVVAGFSQDDWIFMDKISFNVDGERFNWDIPFGDRNTEVGWGSIYEWMIKIDLLDSTLKEDLYKIANAKSVVIRFDGATNSRDETISQKQKQQILDALELYELLNKYGI